MAATSTTPRPRPRTARGTLIFLKMLMALSGLLFVFYVLVHMYGNLKVFAGAEAFNEYAHHLRTLGEPMLPYEGFLWLFRALLLGSLIVHVYAAVKLKQRSSAARTQRYAVKKNGASSFASRTMLYGGIALLAFIVFHILHLTTHTITPQGDQPSPYDNVVYSFDKWWLVLIYLLALVALSLHLFHGVWSACQTLGLTNSARQRNAAKSVAYVLAVVVCVGFALPPLAILFTLVP